MDDAAICRPIAAKRLKARLRRPASRCRHRRRPSAPRLTGITAYLLAANAQRRLLEGQGGPTCVLTNWAASSTVEIEALPRIRGTIARDEDEATDETEISV